MKPDIFGQRYEVLKQLGAGGMGRIYLAKDDVLGRQVAIKLIRESYADDLELVERFHREARAAAAIRHPNIVQVFEVSQTDHGLPFIVMEALKGRDLRAELKSQGSLSLTQAVDVAGQILFALGAAHRAGIVHRDLKPGNIFLTARELASFGDFGSAKEDESSRWTIKLLDFGISRFVRSERMGGEQDLTAQDAILGTLNYAAPEQLDDSRKVDGRADLYSVGVILYEILSGRSPFGEDDGVMTAMNRAFHRARPPLHELVDDVPPELDDVLSRALAESPDERFSNATAFVEALRPFYGSEKRAREKIATFTSRQFDTDEVFDAEVARRAEAAFVEAETTLYHSAVNEIVTEVEAVDDGAVEVSEEEISPSEQEVTRRPSSEQQRSLSVALPVGPPALPAESAPITPAYGVPFGAIQPPDSPAERSNADDDDESEAIPKGRLLLLGLIAFGATSVVAMATWFLMRSFFR